MFRSILAVILFPILSNAGQQPQSSYKCVPSLSDSKLDAGPTDGVISKIKSLEVSDSADLQNLKIKMLVEGVSAIDSANNNKSAKESNEVYRIKELKSGTFFELAAEDTNTFKFDAVFLEFGSTNVATAGPLPEGTYDMKISMAFVDSNVYYKNPSPMMVKKIVFDCKNTIKY